MEEYRYDTKIYIKNDVPFVQGVVFKQIKGILSSRGIVVSDIKINCYRVDSVLDSVMELVLFFASEEDSLQFQLAFTTDDLFDRLREIPILNDVLYLYQLNDLVYIR